MSNITGSIWSTCPNPHASCLSITCQSVKRQSELVVAEENHILFGSALLCARAMSKQIKKLCEHNFSVEKIDFSVSNVWSNDTCPIIREKREMSQIRHWLELKLFPATVPDYMPVTFIEQIPTKGQFLWNLRKKSKQRILPEQMNQCQKVVMNVKILH